MSKKIIFFDVDGTLISYSKTPHIPKKTIHTLKELQANGHQLIIATGRSYPFTKRLMGKLNIQTAILNNGAQIISNDQIIYEKRIDQASSKMIYDAIIDSSFPIIAFDDQRIYIRNISKESLDYILNEIEEGNIVQIITDTVFDFLSINLYEVPDHISKLLLEIPDIEYAQNEIKAAGISKGSALRYLSSTFGYLYDDMITVGDGIHDISMFHESAISIAVKNAPESVKDSASIVLSYDIEKGGLFEVFKELSLI